MFICIFRILKGKTHRNTGEAASQSTPALRSRIAPVD
jgi:hypothetical protein